MFSGIPLFPDQASTFAPRVDNLYFFIVAVTAFFAIVVTVVVIVFAVKYRTNDPLAVGARIHGSIPLELAWSIIPFIISLVIFGWAADVFFDLQRPPNQTLEIYATGKRWMWKFQHLDGQNEINELHVPLGRAVKITFTSEDVLHSLFFPAFRTKADAIPGRYSSVWFTPSKVGEFHLFCAEYCGTRHSGMVGRVVVMEPADYQSWLSGSVPGTSLAARGEQLFNDLSCNTCHRNDGSGRGPSLVNKFGAPQELGDGTTVTVTDTYVRESILTPQAKLAAGYQPLMPTFQGLISEENVLALVEYVKTLKAPTGGVSEASAATPGESARPAPQENR
jgi:cytochrome c oxidase subunit 2